MDTSRKKLIGLIIFCLGVLVYVGALAWLNIRDFQKTLVDQTQNHLYTIARTQVKNVESAVWNVQQELEMLSINPRVQDAIVFGQCDIDECAEKNVPAKCSLITLKIPLPVFTSLIWRVRSRAQCRTIQKLSVLITQKRLISETLCKNRNLLSVRCSKRKTA